MRVVLVIIFIFFAGVVVGQVKWTKVDSLFGHLPSSVHVYKTTDPIDGKPNIAYYIEADLRDKKLEFTTDTTLGRRLTPSQFYNKGAEQSRSFNFPLVVVNTTFFSFATNQNLNVVVRNGQLLSYNIHSLPGRGKDTLTYRHPYGSAIGISKKRKADIAWLYTDSSRESAYAIQFAPPLSRNAVNNLSYDSAKFYSRNESGRSSLRKWKMQAAVGGGPVLVQNGEIKVSNNEEYKFAGKAIDDKHPRTAMGYTRDRKLIIMVIEGRHPGSAEGATLLQEAKLLKDIGCVEALNLDGGGSSCMLVNGMETIKVSDPTQRPVPAVFVIKNK